MCEPPAGPGLRVVLAWTLLCPLAAGTTHPRAMTFRPEPSPVQVPLVIPTVEAVIGGPGEEPGRFRGPFGIALTDDGEVWVVDDLAHRVSVFDDRGRWRETYGAQGAAPGELAWPDGASFDASTGEIYLADNGNHRIQVWSRRGEPRREIGPRLLGSSLRNPRDVFVDPGGGGILVADFGHGRIRVFDRDGRLLRDITGAGTAGALQAPIQVAVSGAGEVYASDGELHAVVVFGADGRYRRTIGAPGNGPGELRAPHGLAFDAAGRLYVADYGNDRIQVFSPDGRPVAIAGTRGREPGQLIQPTDVALAPDGRLFVVDKGNQRVQVWRVDLRRPPS